MQSAIPADDLTAYQRLGFGDVHGRAWMPATGYPRGMSAEARRLSTPKPTGDQLRLINAVYDRFAAAGEWPLIDHLQHEYDLAEGEFDVDAVAESLDRKVGWQNRGQNDTVELTLCGVALAANATDDLADVLAVGQHAFGRYLKEGPGFLVESSEIAPALGNDRVRVAKVLVLGQWLPGFGGGSRNETSWSRQITREVRRWRGVETIEQMVGLDPCSRIQGRLDPTLGRPAAVSPIDMALGEHKGEASPEHRGSYSMREFGVAAPTRVDLVDAAWGGLIAIVKSLVNTSAFARSYPSVCEDYPGQVVGTDLDTLAMALADQTSIGMPLDVRKVPTMANALDLIEFAYAHVAQARPQAGGWHDFFKHLHLQFDIQAGQQSFLEDINMLFQRHKIAFRLDPNGRVERPGSPAQQVMEASLPPSGDASLDQRLARALELFRNPDLESRAEATRELWDCFERLKSLADPNDKKRSTSALLESLGGARPLSSVVAADAADLTKVGNRFGIRHAEMGQHEISDPYEVDYVFGRLFNLIWSLLRARADRGTEARE